MTAHSCRIRSGRGPVAFFGRIFGQKVALRGSVAAAQGLTRTKPKVTAVPPVIQIGARQSAIQNSWVRRLSPKPNKGASK